ncbi:hypothetical protein BCV71DRAFT_265924 [Rhizopus microsporus]|uniref:Uncharacterized protein n=1 Tax=Rhizopus microsporus TaxID=58291 RepID=A0A1X0RVT4_RHIZD|nr:hypothetical protein BCV71DRAFT_265924 [Rhizopus microsporus]
MTSSIVDRLSGRATSLYEWKLPTKRFQPIQRKWGQYTIDAFTARYNDLLLKFWSLHQTQQQQQ